MSEEPRERVRFNLSGGSLPEEMEKQNEDTENQPDEGQLNAPSLAHNSDVVCSATFWATVAENDKSVGKH